MLLGDLEDLVDVLDDVIPEEDVALIPAEEEEDIINTTMLLLTDYIDENPSAVSEPDFHDTKVAFRGNGYPVQQRAVFGIYTQRFATQRQEQCFPYIYHILVGHFVGKAATRTIFWVFPHRCNAFAHNKQHTVFHDVVGHRFH
jgi:hypothetical protein